MVSARLSATNFKNRRSSWITLFTTVGADDTSRSDINITNYCNGRVTLNTSSSCYRPNLPIINTLRTPISNSDGGIEFPAFILRLLITILLFGASIFIKDPMPLIFYPFGFFVAAVGE